MRLIRLLQSRLTWKVFASYLAVVVVGGIVLLAAGELHMPVAFQRHLAAMAAQMENAESLAGDLYHNFREALVEAGAIALAFSMITAIGLSYYVSRRITRPILDMLRATERIADGHYAERIELSHGHRAIQDLDELELLAVSFNRMAAALERTEEHRRELIGNVAHELRTPLSTIRGYMEGLIDGVLPPDATTFERVQREAERLQRLVSDLQELSHLEEGAFALDLVPLAPDEVIQAVVARLRPQFEEKGLVLTLDLPPRLPKILADRDRLEQVLVNLLGNALQYTPSGRGVHVFVTPQEKMLRIAVRDEGIGIPPAHVPHLFERFYRVDPSRSRVGGGTGIGLTITKLLVEAHGGKIVAHSDGVDKGSEFAFTIPLA